MIRALQIVVMLSLPQSVLLRGLFRRRAVDGLLTGVQRRAKFLGRGRIQVAGNAGSPDVGSLDHFALRDRAVVQQLLAGIGGVKGRDGVELLDHAVFYTPQSADPAESPAHVIESDLAAGKIDMAITWGPMAGFLAGRHAQSPAWRALPFKPDPKIKFDYEISMGVRFGEKEWKDTLDQWISAHERVVQAILSSYRVPLLDVNGNLIASLP